MSKASWPPRRIELGQLRRWRVHTKYKGKVFLVVGCTRSPNGMKHWHVMTEGDITRGLSTQVLASISDILDESSEPAGPRLMPNKE